jgi:hypothetical protein
LNVPVFGTVEAVVGVLWMSALCRSEPEDALHTDGALTVPWLVTLQPV